MLVERDIVRVRPYLAQDPFSAVAVVLIIILVVVGHHRHVLGIVQRAEAEGVVVRALLGELDECALVRPVRLVRFDSKLVQDVAPENRRPRPCVDLVRVGIFVILVLVLVLVLVFVFVRRFVVEPPDLTQLVCLPLVNEDVHDVAGDCVDGIYFVSL